MSDKKKAFGVELRKSRVDAGISVLTLASLMGVSRGAVASWEEGRTKIVASNFKKLCKQFENLKAHDNVEVVAMRSVPVGRSGAKKKARKATETAKPAKAPAKPAKAPAKLSEAAKPSKGPAEPAKGPAEPAKGPAEPSDGSAWKSVSVTPLNLVRLGLMIGSNPDAKSLLYLLQFSADNGLTLRELIDHVELVCR